MDMDNVADRLASRFGLGSRPDLRGPLYQRLQDLVFGPDGQEAYRVISSVAADAIGKRDPGRYFAHVVMLRLQERGIIPLPEPVF